MGIQKNQKNVLICPVFWVGGFVGWLPKTVLPDISVQLLALDVVDVNPIQYQMINCQIYIRF